MFKNHSTIKQKIILSDEILGQAYMCILEKIEALETNREFLKIIKHIKDEQKKRK